MKEYKLTQYSHGAGCGCKISPEILEKLLKSDHDELINPKLLVGNETKDDAAVYDLENGTAVISTTDFFMPIVDDAFDFGAIASANALSDVYAMGGYPIMAVSILGWPVDKIPTEIAGEVLNGCKSICKTAGLTLAGGHSIDSPEPIFGLAVTGLVNKKNLKRNNTAKAGSLLYLTKPLGIGLITTAQKKGEVNNKDLQQAKASMVRLNDLGFDLGNLSFVNAMTDVTGFGLLGHLIEMCEGSKLSAEIEFTSVPRFDTVTNYIDKQCIPGGTKRNWDSYGHKIEGCDKLSQILLSDPQTSGGLLVSVDKNKQIEFDDFLTRKNYQGKPFGRLIKRERITIKVI